MAEDLILRHITSPQQPICTEFVCNFWKAGLKIKTKSPDFCVTAPHRGALFVQESFAISLGLDEEENEKRAELRIKT